MFQEQSSRLMGRFGMEGNDGRDTLNPWGYRSREEKESSQCFGGPDYGGGMLNKK